MNTYTPGKTLVHSLLDEAVADAPESTAVRDRTGAWRYREVAEYSHAVENWLARNGVGHGDRVLVRVPTTRELVALMYGISRRGAIFVPLNPEMKSFHVRSVIENAEPSLVIVTEAEAATIGALTEAPVHALPAVWGEVESLRGNRIEPTAVDQDDVAVLIYTSGSTAAPKGVIGPHAQVTFASHAINAELGYRPDDVVFCRFPISWDYGLYKVLLSCIGRSEIVLAGTESDLVLLRRMREVGATVVPIVPSLATMIATLAARDNGPAAPVRLFTNTGAALPAATIEKLRAAFPGVKVVRQFGQTECKRITVMPPNEDTERPDSVGRPLPGTAVLILDNHGADLPIGEVGEIVAAGPHVMPGYWRAPELTARAFRRADDGTPLLHTGDYGYLDEDGYLYFTGRRDDMFKRKGIRMSTLEIEAAAMDIEGIHAAAAIPPSDGRDLALCAETDLDPHVVLKELSGRLEPQKVPASCHVFDELPLTAHGKNATRELAALLDGASQ